MSRKIFSSIQDFLQKFLCNIFIGSIFLLSALCVFSSPIYAVSLHELTIIDTLHNNFSMTETILLNISDNADKGFSLTFPQDAYNIFVDGISANHTISDEVACEECVVEIVYSYPNIIFNDSDTDNLTFYRTIDLPVNATIMTYAIKLPPNHTIRDLSNTWDSVMPTPQNIIINEADNTILFEWRFIEPEFPKEFAVRYSEISVMLISEDELINGELSSDKNSENISDGISIMSLAIIGVVLVVIIGIIAFIVGLSIGSKKKRNK